MIYGNCKLISNFLFFGKQIVNLKRFHYNILDVLPVLDLWRAPIKLKLIFFSFSRLLPFTFHDSRRFCNSDINIHFPTALERSSHMTIAPRVSGSEKRIKINVKNWVAMNKDAKAIEICTDLILKMCRGRNHCPKTVMFNRRLLGA